MKSYAKPEAFFVKYVTRMLLSIHGCQMLYDARRVVHAFMKSVGSQ